MMYLAPLTVTPGRTKLTVLIIELYGIAGVTNILLDVTFFMCCYVDLCMY